MSGDNISLSTGLAMCVFLVLQTVFGAVLMAAPAFDGGDRVCFGT